MGRTTVRVGFRLDANINVATGHMMRCVSIANKCRELGMKCIFIISDTSNEEILQKNQFEYHVINAPWDDWNAGINEVTNYIEYAGIEFLVVDSYLVTEEFMTDVNRHAPVMYIDDMCRCAYDISFALHYSQWPEEDTLQKLYDGKKTGLLTGMKYMPLRDEFSSRKKVTSVKKQIMLTTGGTDQYHITQRLARMILEDERFKDYTCVAVLGRMNSDRQAMDNMAEHEKRLVVLQNISNMAEIMRQSAVAVSGGGTSIYELCACNTPTVCVAFAEDHVAFAQKMESHGILKYAGDARIDTDGVLRKTVECIYEILSTPEYISRCRINMSRIIDGNGALRIAEYIQKNIGQQK